MNTLSRINAYQDIMRKYGLPVHPHWSRTGVHSIRQGEQLVRELLACAEERPNAILCANDLVAAGIVSEARRQQLRIPEDLAVVGFDSTELAHTLGITSIYNPIADQAKNAFHLLLSKLSGVEEEPQKLKYCLVQRATT
ncbi:HTH-type transcriptional repressor CytR [compost metagenome]